MYFYLLYAQFAEVRNSRGKNKVNRERIEKISKHLTTLDLKLPFQSRESDYLCAIRELKRMLCVGLKSAILTVAL